MTRFRSLAHSTRALWAKVAEPRVQRLAFLFVYLLLAQSGINALVSPPNTLEGAWGAGLTTVWACAISFGGVVGAIAVLPGWNFIERPAVIAVMTGAFMYGSMVLWLHYTSSGQRLTQWGFVFAWVAIFLWRLWEVRRYAIAPKE